MLALDCLRALRVCKARVRVCVCTCGARAHTNQHTCAPLLMPNGAGASHTHAPFSALCRRDYEANKDKVLDMLVGVVTRVEGGAAAGAGGKA